MITESLQDYIYVRFVTYNEDKDKENFICGFKTTNYNEILKMFITAKQYDIECFFNEFSDEVPEKYLDKVFLVKDVYIRTGGDTDITSIVVVLS